MHIRSSVSPALDASAEAVRCSWSRGHARGDLDNLNGLKAAAAEADGVIHLAFKHEAMRTGDLHGRSRLRPGCHPGDR